MTYTVTWSPLSRSDGGRFMQAPDIKGNPFASLEQTIGLAMINTLVDTVARRCLGTDGRRKTIHQDSRTLIPNACALDRNPRTETVRIS